MAERMHRSGTLPGRVRLFAPRAWWDGQYFLLGPAAYFRKLATPGVAAVFCRMCDNSRCGYDQSDPLEGGVCRACTPQHTSDESAAL